MNAKKVSGVALLGVILLMTSCKKDNVAPVGLYTPTTSDVTAKATLSELQQGQNIYVNKCGSCHRLYSPDDFSTTNWKSVMSSMAPQAGLSSSESALVLKYVTRGN